MAAPSPPKPWERGGGATSASVGLTGSGATTSQAAPIMATSTSASSNPPPLPELPNALSSVANRNANNYSTMNANRYSSPYGGGGYNNYSSPYSRMGGGGYGSMYGGGGGMYGNMGGMGGMGGMGMGMGMGGMYGGMGMPGDPNNQSLTQSFSQSTQATFQLIESIVGAFGGFAQMLESTYMATHSSFFAMVSVAEQFGTLRQTLGSVLGIFTLMRWIRTAIAKLTGRPLPASSTDLTPASFAAFTGRLPDGSPAAAKPSKKPFIMFMVAVFGLPYLMGKLIKALARSQEEQEKRKMAENPQAYGEQLDPSKLEFCRVLYDFTPDSNMNAAQGLDLPVKKGDMVAVLSKTDPLGNPSEWWRCRARDGRMGYLPGVYLEVIQRRHPAQITSGSQAGSPAGSRAQTMTSSSGSRAATLTEAKVPEKALKPEGKVADMGVESFQKGAFYS
ncbi:Peroxin 13, N-terminal region-domain-containing protein [Massariosphaeria phaeospora]|uniref:Peroxisomal membrane protein PEX13 n=1 Tax=Massariosphaeria phaeospora TaxID=100035 RepID=A0A7C8M3X7_9PLEO|nr:Peroxin 13, N-terminal region-domain-containing protein [Massariosphaeria phaeospora]